jgi:hypothetical protein
LGDLDGGSATTVMVFGLLKESQDQTSSGNSPSRTVVLLLGTACDVLGLYLERHQINSKLKLCSRALQIQP